MRVSSTTIWRVGLVAYFFVLMQGLVVPRGQPGWGMIEGVAVTLDGFQWLPDNVSLTDMLVNYGCFFVLGWFLILARLFGSRKLAALAGPALFALFLSACVEFWQQFVPGRFPSGLDILADGLGAACGGWAALLVRARVNRLVDHWLDSRGGTGLMAMAYAALLIAFCLWPFDFRSSPSEIMQGLRNVQLGLSLPQGESPLPLLLHRLRDLLLYLPLGFLCSLGTWAREKGSVGRWMAFLAPAAFESAQIFVVGRFTSLQQVIAGTLGIAVGVLASRFWSEK